VRNSDLSVIKRLYAEGKTMAACNVYSESILHMACRRAELDVVDFVLSHGSDLNIVDDYGRTPLHDACWRSEPRFDVITAILDRDLSLLRTVDIRGATPLSYVREEHWLHWCAYFFHQKEKYWYKAGTDAATALMRHRARGDGSSGDGSIGDYGGGSASTYDETCTMSSGNRSSAKDSANGSTNGSTNGNGSGSERGSIDASGDGTSNNDVDSDNSDAGGQQGAMEEG